LFYDVFEKGRKPEKERRTKESCDFCKTKVRVRLTLIKIKCMIAEITINMLGISFESFGELGLMMILMV